MAKPSTETILLEAVELLLARHDVEAYNNWADGGRDHRKLHELRELIRERLVAPNRCGNCGHVFGNHEGDGGRCLLETQHQADDYGHWTRCQCSGFIINPEAEAAASARIESMEESNDNSNRP